METAELKKGHFIRGGQYCFVLVTQLLSVYTIRIIQQNEYCTVSIY